jgi:UDP-N-acetylmuramoylalanine--D-glutamate ligase
LNPDFSSQTLLIIGLAREGRTAARWLAQHHARVIASDLRPPQEDVQEELTALGVTLAIGPQTPDLLNDIDAIVVSPGVPQDIPLLKTARQRHIPLTAEPRLFAQACPAPLIGITGSSGKTTTTTLVARMLERSGFHTWLGGNIGAPLLEKLEAIHPEDRVVMELSSFQLLYWQNLAPWPGAPEPWNRTDGISPGIAAVLNITPNHLDRHPSMAHYTAAKANILAAQGPDDIAILNREDPVTRAWARSRQVDIAAGPGQPACRFPLHARLLTFGFDQPEEGDGTWLAEDSILLRREGRTEAILNASDIRLRGRHNLANVLAAVAIAAAAGAHPEAMRAAVLDFSGVPHRLEEVARIHDVLWINDSIATAPERALAALRSFDEPIILLAGGRDKHLPWDEWAQEVMRRARIVIAFGEAIPIIQQALHQPAANARLQKVLTAEDLPAAVALAAKTARAGEIVLLSPGGTSFDAYPDFAARGQHFRELVRQMQQTAP